MVAPAGAGPWPQITSTRPLLTSWTMTGTSPPGPLRWGSTTCKVKAVATAASNALPPFSRVAMPTAVAIQWVEVTTPNVPSISGRVVKGLGLMLLMDSTLLHRIFGLAGPHFTTIAAANQWLLRSNPTPQAFDYPPPPQGFYSLCCVVTPQLRDARVDRACRKAPGAAIAGRARLASHRTHWKNRRRHGSNEDSAPVRGLHPTSTHPRRCSRTGSPPVTPPWRARARKKQTDSASSRRSPNSRSHAPKSACAMSPTAYPYRRQQA